MNTQRDDRHVFCHDFELHCRFCICNRDDGRKVPKLRWMRFCGLRFQGTSVKYRWDIVYTCNLFVTLQKKTFSNQSKGHLGSRCIMYYNYYHYVYADRCTHAHMYPPGWWSTVFPRQKVCICGSQEILQLEQFGENVFLFGLSRLVDSKFPWQPCRRLIWDIWEMSMALEFGILWRNPPVGPV